LDLSGSAFKKQFGRADKAGAAACLILGEAEAENGTVQVKWLATKEQSELAQADLVGQFENWREEIAKLRSVT
jgi:histidyl-tRNA synthetase